MDIAQVDPGSSPGIAGPVRSPDTVSSSWTTSAIDTWNAESNAHMIGVDELLGYRVMGREIVYQRSG